MWGEPDGGRTQEVYVCVEYENIQPFLTEEIIQSCSEYRQSQKASKDLMWGP